MLGILQQHVLPRQAVDVISERGEPDLGDRRCAPLDLDDRVGAVIAHLD
jgi:hypothetical protein